MTLNNRPVFVIEDFTALGQISMVAALTILQALDIETAAVPTEILSTHTEGYGKPAILATSEWLPRCFKHWEQVKDLSFYGGLIGYIGNEKLIDLLAQFLLEQKNNINGPVIVDPAMADAGSLYPGLSPNYPQQIFKLCQQANIITPNWTELCLLTGQEPSLRANQGNFLKLCKILRQKQIKAKLIVTGIQENNQELVYIDDGQQIAKISNKHIEGHYYGAGDSFTALLLAYLCQEYDLREAVQLANSKIQIAIEETQGLDINQRRYGLKLGKLIKSL